MIENPFFQQNARQQNEEKGEEEDTSGRKVRIQSINSSDLNPEFSKNLYDICHTTI